MEDELDFLTRSSLYEPIIVYKSPYIKVYKNLGPSK